VTGQFIVEDREDLRVSAVSDVGEITVQVQDRNGDPVNNTSVELSRDGSSNNPIRTTSTGENSNILTFDNLAVGDGVGNAETYTISANADRFQSQTDQVDLFVDDDRTDRTGPTRTLTLDDASEPNVLGVNAFDSENELATGDTGAVFANGEFDSQAEFVVFAQDQFGGPVGEEVSVTIQNDTGAATVPVQFVDDANDEGTDTIDLTIDSNSPTANLDNDDATGEFSYETFSITADGIDEDDVTTFDSDIINVSSNDINGDVSLDGDGGRTEFQDYVDNFGQDQVDQTAAGEVAAEGFYFVEGDQSVTGDVRVQGDNDNREDVTVYAAYDGLSDKTLEAVEQLQNSDGESFLVDESGPDGYEITGLAGDRTDFKLIAVEDGFNSFQTDGDSGTRSADVGGIDRNVAYYEDLRTPDPGSTVTQDIVLQPEVQEYNIDVTVDDGSGDFVKETRLQDSQETTVQVEVDARPFNDDEASFEDAPEGTTVDLEALLLDDSGNIDTDTDGDRVDPESGLVNDSDVQVVEESVELDADGTATTTFRADEEVTETVNVTANITNADGVVFSTLTDDGAFADDGDRSDAELDGEVINSADGPAVNTDGSQAQIEVFESGSITGDVVDEEDENVEQADATLSVEVTNDDGEDVFVPANESDLFADDFQATRNTGGDGSYAFTGLPTGENYRVDAEATFINADGEEVTFSGRNTEDRIQGDDGLQGGTTGGVDVVLTDLVLGEIPDPNPEPGLARFDTSGDGEIGFNEVLNAIEANNEGTEIGGEPVEFDDVLDAIAANNEGTAV